MLFVARFRKYVCTYTFQTHSINLFSEREKIEIKVEHCDSWNVCSPLYDSSAIRFIISINLLDLDTEKLAPAFFFLCLFYCQWCASLSEVRHFQQTMTISICFRWHFLRLYIQLFHPVSFSCRQCWMSGNVEKRQTHSHTVIHKRGDMIK